MKKAGLEVIQALDLDKTAFDRTIRNFSASLVGAEAGVFFYAGHGLQVAGKNYLVPIDAELSTAEALEFEMVQLDVVHRIMERQTSTNIIFACRNNPLSRNLARAMGTRSADIGRGLAVVESGVGTLISFSTQPGNVALDGMGRNSPFAGALVKRIASSKDDLSALSSMYATMCGERPRTSKFHGNIRRSPDGSTWRSASRCRPPGRIARERSSASVGNRQDSNDQSVLDAFAKQFGDTVYGALAKARLEELRQSTKTAVVVTPTPQIKASPKRESGEFSRVEQLGCQPARAAKDRLIFDAGNNAKYSALRIKAWGNDVDIEEVVVRYVGAVRPATHKNRVFVKYSTGSPPIFLEDATPAWSPRDAKNELIELAKGRKGPSRVGLSR